MDGKLLYVDALNYSNQFGFVMKCWNLTFPTRRIKEFIEAAKVSGFTLKVFIDAGIESDEAIDKWKSRREKELLGEYKDVPQGLSTLVGDIFRLNGIEIAYSPHDADNDDCIAAHAQADGADILSNDKDFFRYTDRKYKLFGEFSIEDGRLILKEKKEPRANPKFPAPTPKAIVKPPVMLQRNPSFHTVETMNCYRRGVPSSLVKLVGNPHAKFVGLRSALYSKMNKTEPVLEEWPEWDHKTEQVVWHSEKVHPGFGDFGKLAALQFVIDVGSNPNYFPIPDIPGLQEWEKRNHRFAILSLMFEIYIAIMGNRQSLYDVLNKYESKVDLPETMELVCAPCSNWFKDGTCKFGKTCLAGEGGHHDCPDFKTKHGCRRGKFCRWRHA